MIQSELYLCCLIAAKYGFLAKDVVLKSDRRIRRKYALFPNHNFLFKTAANIKFSRGVLFTTFWSLQFVLTKMDALSDLGRQSFMIEPSLGYIACDKTPF